MILPIEWLKEYVDVTETPEELAEIFLSLGFPSDEVNNNFLDIEITPNRGDCLSVLGLAREYAASKNITPREKLTPLRANDRRTGMVAIEPSVEDAIPRYSYFIAEGPRDVISSPLISERLKLINLNSKNAIVDITNYIMHETGQPLHAFDLDKIKSINIGYAKQGQTINLLNNQSIKLSSINLIARDGEHPIDLVGVCGGQTTAVDEHTTRILVQAAAINPEVARRTARSSGISTPASYRYERYVDVELTLRALGKAARLLKTFGYNVTEVMDIYPRPFNTQAITLTPQDYARINGMEITADDIASALAPLGFMKITDGSYSVPSWRLRDVTNTEALAEEVLRLKGFDAIPEKPLSQSDNKYDENNYAINHRAKLAHDGWTENYSYSFVSHEDIIALNLTQTKLVEIGHPPSVHYRYLRPNLTMGLLRAALVNPWFSDINMFEIGNVFADDKEKTNIGFISTRSSDISIGETITITPDSTIGQYLGSRRNLYYSETELTDHKPSGHTEPSISAAVYRQVSKYPPVVLDIAVVVDKDTDTNNIIDEILNINHHILLAEVFDEYESDKLGGDKKSVAIRMVYQDTEKTLTGDQASRWHNEMIEFLKEKYHAYIRES